jgi:aryl-alcohol dehydrogenase
MEALLNGCAIRGMVEGDSIPDIFIRRLKKLYEQGCFPFDRGFAFYPLDQINKLAEDSKKGKVLKPDRHP